jgi:hypothetical protein
MTSLSMSEKSILASSPSRQSRQQPGTAIGAPAARLRSAVARSRRTVAMAAIVLSLSAQAFAACDPADTNYVRCLYNEDMDAAGMGGGGQRRQELHAVPNPVGGYTYSNGVFSHYNPGSGGYDYSNGVRCIPNPTSGGMDCR